jgi:hypothetical protein
MLRPFRFAAVSAAAIALLLASVPSASAAVIPGWYSSTDLSAIVATGNSDTLNVGATVNLRRQGLRSSWNTTASFTRNDVRDPQRLAIISGGNAVIEKGELSAKSEKLFANSAYEYRITERFFWNLGASGERDKFAGLNSRLTGFLGLGYLWQNTDGSSLVRLGGAGTYTAQDEVIDDPDTENQFAGVRGTLDVERRFGDRKQHAFTSNLIVDENRPPGAQGGRAVGLRQRSAAHRPAGRGRAGRRGVPRRHRGRHRRRAQPDSPRRQDRDPGPEDRRDVHGLPGDQLRARRRRVAPHSLTAGAGIGSSEPANRCNRTGSPPVRIELDGALIDRADRQLLE